MEVYTLTLSFPYNYGEEGEPWSRTFEVKEDFTLLELHNYIQYLLGFDDDHLYEFFIAKNPRNRSEKVSLSTALNEIYPITGYKLYYLFDFGDNWLFQIKKSRKKKTEVEGKLYPALIESIGEDFEQYPDYDEDGEIW